MRRRVAAYNRRFHDPFGSQNGNVFGSVARFQYLVGKCSLGYVHANFEEDGVDEYIYKYNNVARRDGHRARFVKACKRHVEGVLR